MMPDTCPTCSAILAERGETYHCGYPACTHGPKGGPAEFCASCEQDQPTCWSCDARRLCEHCRSEVQAIPKFYFCSSCRAIRDEVLAEIQSKPEKFAVKPQ
jgi:hypothetical protein